MPFGQIRAAPGKQQLGCCRKTTRQDRLYRYRRDNRHRSPIVGAGMEVLDRTAEGAMMKLFQQSYDRCNELWSHVIGQLSTCVLGHVTERLLVGLEHPMAAAVVHGLRYTNLGIETLERSQATRLFLRELIPFTVKKVTKDVKMRNVALDTRRCAETHVRIQCPA